MSKKPLEASALLFLLFLPGKKNNLHLLYDLRANVVHSDGYTIEAVDIRQVKNAFLRAP